VFGGVCVVRKAHSKNWAKPPLPPSTPPCGREISSPSLEGKNYPPHKGVLVKRYYLCRVGKGGKKLR
jgi:hypothetical protein